jgi:hypothetical protein
MVKSRSFPTAADVSPAGKAKLTEAYKLACDELVREYRYTSEKLAIGFEPMTIVLLELYRIGERDEAQLCMRAVCKALATVL